MENMEIRREAARNGLKLWEVAEACGVTDSTFSRKLRHELPSEQRDHILSMIRKLAEHKAEQEAESGKKGGIQRCRQCERLIK